MNESIGLTAAFVAGLVGSGHCFAMCGGMAAALGLRREGNGDAVKQRRRNAVLYHAGRVGGYSTAGGLSGSVGAVFTGLSDAPMLVVIARVLSGVVLIAIAARWSLRWNLTGAIERLGARVWMRLRPIAARSAAHSGVGSAFLLGILWGWLPCGLVYSMLLLAALSQHALMGATLMAAYGLGTVPTMLSTTLFAAHAQRWMQLPATRIVSSLLLLVLGSWTIYAAMLPAPLAHCH